MGSERGPAIGTPALSQANQQATKYGRVALLTCVLPRHHRQVSPVALFLPQLQPHDHRIMVRRPVRIRAIQPRLVVVVVVQRAWLVGVDVLVRHAGHLRYQASVRQNVVQVAELAVKDAHDQYLPRRLVILGSFDKLRMALLGPRKYGDDIAFKGVGPVDFGFPGVLSPLLFPSVMMDSPRAVVL